MNLFGMSPNFAEQVSLGVVIHRPPHLSAGQRSVSDFASHLGEDGDEPALAVKLLPEIPTNAAEQSGQKVLIASAKLTVLQVVLQQPETQRRT